MFSESEIENIELLTEGDIEILEELIRFIVDWRNEVNVSNELNNLNDEIEIHCVDSDTQFGVFVSRI